METTGFIFDYILGRNDLIELNLIKYIKQRVFREGYYGEPDDESYVVKFSLILGFRRWMDIPSFLENDVKYLNNKIYRIIRKYRWEIEDYMWQRGLDEKESFSDELIFNNLELFTKEGIMIFRPRVYPIEILKRWHDVWTRPSILCPRERYGNRYGGQMYFLIPPRYSVIEEGGYRVSIRDEFRNFEYHLYSSGDRDYIALPWSCYDPDFLELSLSINKLENIEEYNRYLKNRKDYDFWNIRGNTLIRVGLKLLGTIADIITFSGFFK